MAVTRSTKVTYVCKMVVKAVPMTDCAFNRKHHLCIHPDARERPGYNVFYGSGFDTWFPKKAFEESHYTRREEIQEASERAKKVLAQQDD